MSCSTNLCEVLKIPITVGRHKQTDLAKAVRQDGFVAAILLLAYFGGLIIALIMARYLSQENVVVSKVDPYVVEIVLIILLLPGFFVITFAFSRRDHARVVRHRQDNVAFHLHEVIAEAGLYIFATCSIAFDIVVLSSEIDCMGLHRQVSSTTDGVIDCIFYCSKIVFTVAQCLFMRKFHHSRFDSNPILQVFLVSIITSNLAIWFYTIIDDDSGALFDEGNVEGSMQDFVCRDKALQANKTKLQPYFSPFTLEFSLLVFERIINIWSKMVDLELIDDVNRDITMRALFNNEELQKIEHDLNEKRRAYKEMHHQAETSQARLTTWMSNLYERLRLNYTGHVRQMVDQIYGYGEKVYNLIVELNKAIDDGGYVIKQVQELRKLNTYHQHIEQALNSGPGASLLVLLNGHNYGIETKREEIQRGLDTTMAELDIAKGRITQLNNEIKQERDRLPRDRPTGYNCGLCCVFALVIIVASFAIGVVVVFITPQSLDITAWLTNNTLPESSLKQRKNFVTFADIVNGMLIITNLITSAVIFRGFWKLLTFKSNYRMFKFTDVFYCLSCFGSILLLSFSAIAACAVRPDTIVKGWDVGASMERNITASKTLSQMSNYNIAFILSQLLQVFLSSVFVIHSCQMLPHGVPRINKPITEVIQFVGMVHFFFWVLNSFLYGPNHVFFYPVEMFYYGSNFEIIARITFPIQIFYHFTTALRCLNLSIKYDSMP